MLRFERMFILETSKNGLGIIDSHSVRMSSISGQQRGIDGNKKIKGRKRHIIVDTMGLIKTEAPKKSNNRKNQFVRFHKSFLINKYFQHHIAV